MRKADLWLFRAAKDLIRSKGAQVTIPDWDKLKEEAGFDPLYLHLEKEVAAA
jgi:hypothetical protein